MQKSNNCHDPVESFVERYCPDLDQPDRRRAKANLRRYLKIVTRMGERIGREASEGKHEDGAK